MIYQTTLVENKYEVNVICLSALNLEIKDVENIILKYNLKHKTHFGDICFDNVIKSDLGASILI